MNKMFNMSKVWFDGSSQHGSYRVIDMYYNRRPARLLYGGGESPQSAMALDDDSEMIFNYNQRFMEIAQSINPKRVLVIGGGAFTLPAALLRRFDDIAVDVVEIDSLLVDLAKQFFGLTDDPRLKAIVGDGRDYLRQTKNQYDLVVVDAFSEYVTPISLLTHQAAELYRAALAPDGLVAINFISAYHVTKPELAHDLKATFGEVFAQVDIYPADYGDRIASSDNLVLVAGNQSLNLDYLQSVPLTDLVGVTGSVLND